MREAKARSARLWDDKANEGIEGASDPVEHAKAKEMAHHYRWRASKVAPRECGEKVDLNHSGVAVKKVFAGEVSLPQAVKQVEATKPKKPDAVPNCFEIWVVQPYGGLGAPCIVRGSLADWSRPCHATSSNVRFACALSPGRALTAALRTTATMPSVPMRENA